MDLEITKFINELGADSLLDFFTQLISNTMLLTILWLAIAIAALILDKKHGKKVFTALLIAIALHFLISEGVFKLLINELRTRPYLAYPDIIASIGNYTDSSFPSSHMSSTAAILTILIYFYRKITIPGILFILIMAFARIHNGMHYPTDVLVGTILGIIYGIIGIYTSRRLKISDQA